MRTRCAVALGLSALVGVGAAFAQGPEPVRTHHRETPGSQVGAIGVQGVLTLAFQEDKDRDDQGPGERGPRPPRFEALDQNNDGKISREEFRGPEEVFKRMDANDDGSVSREEFDKASQEFRQKMIERLKGQDKDGDGKISREEFQGPERFFDRLDANKDGSLSKDEIEAGPGGERPREGAGDQPRPEGNEGSRGPRPDPFQEVDKDGDGKITRDEVHAIFDRMDFDKDGALTREEIGGAMLREGIERLRQMDTNKDQKVSREEFRGPEAVFERLDIDNDKAITREDVGRAMVRLGVQWLRRMDTNHDEKISRDEYHGPEELFQRLDADGDNSITRDEVRDAVRRFRERQGRGRDGSDGAPPSDENKNGGDRPEAKSNQK